MKDEIAVVILAGGQGHRIGGAKPQKALAGERLIERAVRLARGYSEPVAVAVRDAQQVAPIDADLISDSPIEGPLGGLASALRFAQSEQRPLLLAIPADMPFLPPDLLDRLADAIGSHACAVASSGGHAHPVCSLWRVDALSRLQDYVESGRRSLRGFAETIGHAVVDWPAEPADPFFNVNSIENLAEAERLLAR